MITQDELKSQLDYDKETGVFTWKVRNSNRVKIGQVAGNAHNCGYIELQVLGEKHLAHRLAWLYVHGEYPKIIDHINGNRSDNRICNLRNVGYKENTYNSKLRKDNKSGVKCVSFNIKLKKYEVRIFHDGKLQNYGYYENLEDAKKVADEKRKEIYGVYFR